MKRAAEGDEEEQGTAAPVKRFRLDPRLPDADFDVDGDDDDDDDDADEEAADEDEAVDDEAEDQQVAEEGEEGSRGGAAAAARSLPDQAKGDADDLDLEAELAPETQQLGAAAGVGQGEQEPAKGNKNEDSDDGEEGDVDEDDSIQDNPEVMKAILARLTPDQMNRYECMRRAGFQRATVRRLLQTVSNTAMTIKTTIVMSGLAKLLVGDIVETAREVMTERGDTGPIRPTHVREAARRVRQAGKLPAQRAKPALFKT
eukprot:jgi/Chlat1/216/Chrsp1S03130